MKVLIIGGGGREHAIAWKIKKDRPDIDLYCAPGNAGISGIANCLPIKATDFQSLVAFAKGNNIDITVVGPDDPLVLGIVDEFEANGLRVFGPNKKAAAIEGSKAYAKNLMKKYGIPTAAYEVFTDYDTAVEYISKSEYPLFIKADGLAVGKGAIVCGCMDEGINALKKIMLDRSFGSSGDKVVVEEFMVGSEVTVLAFSDGNTIAPMVSAQDHKRAYDGDNGLNTGGMGAISPCRLYTADVERESVEKIFIPTINALKNEGIIYKGVIYFELMLTNKSVKVIEYNCRFGDPEAQVVLPKLKNDLLDVINACIDGKLSDIDIKWEDIATVCVIAASGGYPESYEVGYIINGLESVDNINNSIVFHAGTSMDCDSIVTSGGRVLGITGMGQTMPEALNNAYNMIDNISFKNMHYRKDIGTK